MPAVLGQQDPEGLEHPGASVHVHHLDRPMDLADASLVWLAGRSGVRDILTVDKGDFAVFRTPQGKPFKDVLAARHPAR